jgi:hypothetical protein
MPIGDSRRLDQQRQAINRIGWSIGANTNSLAQFAVSSTDVLHTYHTCMAKKNTLVQKIDAFTGIVEIGFAAVSADISELRTELKGDIVAVHTGEFHRALHARHPITFSSRSLRRISVLASRNSRVGEAHRWVP